MGHTEIEIGPRWPRDSPPAALHPDARSLNLVMQMKVLLALGAGLGVIVLALFLVGARPGGTAAAPPAAAPPATAGLPRIETPTGVPMVLVPGGEFTMGHEGGPPDARHVHRVRVSPFYMDVHEVTQAGYQELVGENPSRWQGDRNPVEQVRWNDAAAYCNARSAKEGLELAYDPRTWELRPAANGYRLPTEAEWEYACRAGGADDTCAGGARDVGEAAWTEENAGGQPHPVGEKRANAWGLHDLLGNVWEWCHDRYDPDYYRASDTVDPRGPQAGAKRVLRGGSFSSRAEAARPFGRFCDDPGTNDVCYTADAYGFRCVRRR